MDVPHIHAAGMLWDDCMSLATRLPTFAPVAGQRRHLTALQAQSAALTFAGVGSDAALEAAGVGAEARVFAGGCDTRIS